MIILKRLWLIPLCLTLSCATAAAWWQSFERDPVAQIQSFTQEVNSILTDAAAAWAIIQPFLTPAQQQTASADYGKAVSVVSSTMGILTDAVQAAADAKTTPQPDFTGLVNNVTAALQQLLDIVSTLQATSQPAPTALPGATHALGALAYPNPALDEAKARLAALKGHAVGSVR